MEIAPRRTVEDRGTRYQELDVNWLLQRHPEVALVGELAHSIPRADRGQTKLDGRMLTNR